MDKVRAAAVEVVHDVFENGAYANVALVNALRNGSYSDIDRRFMTELVYGTVKAAGTLDWIIRQYVSRPVSKMKPYIRAILRVGAYQLRYLEKVPDAAVCNESVEIAKKYGNAGEVKFVNAVLRNLARSPEKAAFPEGKGKATQHLALSSMHPEWIVRRWIKQLGYDAAECLCTFDHAPAVLSVRTNTLKTTRDELLSKLLEEGWDAEASEFAPEGIVCRGSHGSLDASRLLAEGYFQVQDESSMQVAHVLEQRGERVLRRPAARPRCGAHGPDRLALLTDLINRTHSSSFPHISFIHYIGGNILGLKTAAEKNFLLFSQQRQRRSARASTPRLPAEAAREQARE